MEKINLSENQIKLIIDKNFDNTFWFYNLGYYSSRDLDTYRDKEFDIDYFKIGFEEWTRFKEILNTILCDKENKVPQEWVNELISGDIREYILALASILVSQYSIKLSLVVPLVALMLKQEIKRFCKEN